MPRASLTNFLTASRLNGALLPVAAGAFGRQRMLLPRGLTPASAANWVSDVRHADEWDPGKGNTLLLMGSIATTARSSSSGQVLLLILLDDSTSPQGKVYLQYCRVPKRR